MVYSFLFFFLPLGHTHTRFYPALALIQLLWFYDATLKPSSGVGGGASDSFCRSGSMILLSVTGSMILLSVTGSMILLSVTGSTILLSVTGSMILLSVTGSTGSTFLLSDLFGGCFSGGATPVAKVTVCVRAQAVWQRGSTLAASAPLFGLRHTFCLDGSYW